MSWLRGRGSGGRQYHQETLDEDDATNRPTNPMMESNDVALGRPVGGSGAAASAGSMQPAPTVQVSGQALGGPAAAAAAPGATKEVRCGKCGHGTVVAVGTRVVECVGCRCTLKADDTPAMQVFCPMCKATNLVQPGTKRLKCGKCDRLLDVPGVAQGVANPSSVQATVAREDVEMLQAVQASLDQTQPSKKG
mmetsp:Transcript_45783/g.106334  ORF Transcript_45783/g.106334 Transcript_45783/m.106334 type:complete len:193 (-) Transcript_45783:137-715(-)